MAISKHLKSRSTNEMASLLTSLNGASLINTPNVAPTTAHQAMSKPLNGIGNNSSETKSMMSIKVKKQPQADSVSEQVTSVLNDLSPLVVGNGKKSKKMPKTPALITNDDDDESSASSCSGISTASTLSSISSTKTTSKKSAKKMAKTSHESTTELNLSFPKLSSKKSKANLDGSLSFDMNEKQTKKKVNKTSNDSVNKSTSNGQKDANKTVNRQVSLKVSHSLISLFLILFKITGE